MSSIIIAKFFCSVFVATTVSVTFGRKIESHSIKARGPQRKTSTYTSNISLYKGHAFFSTRYQHLWSSHLFHEKKRTRCDLYLTFSKKLLISNLVRSFSYKKCRLRHGIMSKKNHGILSTLWEKKNMSNLWEKKSPGIPKFKDHFIWRDLFRMFRYHVFRLIYFF